MKSIITLNWCHFKDLTLPWLEDLEKHTNPPYEVVVVDQGSDNGDVELLKEASTKMPFLVPVFLKENVGFPEGNNIGVRASKGDIIIYSNNDIRIHGDWLEPVLSHLETNPNSLVGTSMVIRGGWNELASYCAPYLEGWMIAAKREVVDKLEGFSTDYFPSSVEDVDLCYRARLLGLDLVEVTPLPMVHMRGATVEDGRLKMMEVTRRNQEIFWTKVRENGFAGCLETNCSIVYTEGPFRVQIVSGVR